MLFFSFVNVQRHESWNFIVLLAVLKPFNAWLVLAEMIPELFYRNFQKPILRIKRRKRNFQNSALLRRFVIFQVSALLSIYWALIFQCH